MGGKFFAYFSHNHHHNGITGLLVKTSGLEEQAMLIESDPALYYRPAELGPSGWIGSRLDHAPVDWAHVKEWLTKSWRVLAPRRLTKLADVAEQFWTIGRSWNWWFCGVPLLVRLPQCRPGSGRS